MTYAQSDLPALIRRREIFKAGNVFSEIRNGIYAVYSYGHHFPLAVYSEDGRWHVNFDKYSPSTTIQQSKTGVRSLPNYIGISTDKAVALINAGDAAYRRDLAIAKVTRRLEYA